MNNVSTEPFVSELKSVRRNLLAELNCYSNSLNTTVNNPVSEKKQTLRMVTYRQASQEVPIPVFNTVNLIHCADFVEDGNTFEEMMRQAEQGMFDMIVTPSIVYFGESIMDAIAWTRVLRDHNPPIAVYFVQEAINTLSTTSDCILFILGLVVEELGRKAI